MVQPMNDISDLLDTTHIAFTDFISYFPCVSPGPSVVYPNALVTCYGYPSRPMIWIATNGRDYSKQSYGLLAAMNELHGTRITPENRYQCLLYCMRPDRCGNKEG